MRALAVLVASAALAACGARTFGGSSPPTPVPVCDAPIVAPEGWRALPVFRETYTGHVGTRRGYRDEAGRELHVFAGIPGEFGEGLPAAGEVELAPGVTGLLSGRGVVWVVEWQEGGRCDPRAALGNGFDKEEFLDAVEDTGVAAGPG